MSHAIRADKEYKSSPPGVESAESGERWGYALPVSMADSISIQVASRYANSQQELHRINEDVDKIEDELDEDAIFEDFKKAKMFAPHKKNPSSTRDYLLQRHKSKAAR